MGIYDSLLPSSRKIEIQYECNNGHIFDGDNPPRFCDECGNSTGFWKYKIINDDRYLIKTTLDVLLGRVCNCCGSEKYLQVDHINGRNSLKVVTIKDILDNPTQYQRLCRECNRWKNNGPCCPCKFWDATYPGWRES
jgi:hypothetical protein